MILQLVIMVRGAYRAIKPFLVGTLTLVWVHLGEIF
jgi:hypothetical protein